MGVDRRDRSDSRGAFCGEQYTHPGTEYFSRMALTGRQISHSCRREPTSLETGAMFLLNSLFGHLQANYERGVLSLPYTL
mmetsp:Transcript_22607/g.56155  ORF Transcript_22607/g.56155 Transcript_22607/m.56155 type:complete len:80 (+) Transcript_22607:24-263(+)